MNEILRAIEQEQIRTDLPQFNVGDNVRVHVKIKEGNRERVQAFEGTVIKGRGYSTILPKRALKICRALAESS